MREEIRVDIRLLERVLHQLTAVGLLEEIHGGGQVRFCLRENLTEQSDEPKWN